MPDHGTTGVPTSASRATTASRSSCHSRWARSSIVDCGRGQRPRGESVDQDQRLTALPQRGHQRRHPLVKQRAQDDDQRSRWHQSADLRRSPGEPGSDHRRVKQPVEHGDESATSAEPAQRPDPLADVDHADTVTAGQVMVRQPGSGAHRDVEAAR